MAFYHILRRIFARKILYFAVGFCAILGNVSYADFTGRLPNSITLQGGQSQTHKAIMDCSSHWECVFGNYSYSFTYSTNGNADSTLTLNATLPQNPASQTKSKPFFIGNMTINPHSNLVMQGFESFNLGGSLNINGGSLVFQNGDFATLFDTNISVGNGGKLGVIANGFTNRGNMSANNATISIIPANARNYGNIYNNNGDITIGTALYNIGQKQALAGASPSSVANIINNGGKLTIQGNLYNGGQENQNSNCRVSGCGGGNITNSGGAITIQGNLISEGKDGQNSSIGIYGGTLSATNLQNKSGSTLTIGADNNGKMGQIIGNVDNTNGTFIIDAAGASNSNHTLITGNLTGQQAILRNGNTEFAISNWDANTKSLKVTLDTAKITSLESTLTPNQKTTLNALGNRIYTTNGATSSSIDSTTQSLNQGAFSAFVSAPFAIISTLKSSLDSSAQNTAQISAKSTSPYKSNGLNLALIGAGLLSVDNATNAAKIGGGGGGVKIGFERDFGLASVRAILPATIGLNAGYTYTALNTSASNSLLSQKNTITAHSAGLNAIFASALSADKRLIFSANLGGFMSFVNVNREVDSSLLSANAPLKSSFALYQIALDLLISYDFAALSSGTSGLNSLAPYFGLHQSINILPSFAESSTDLANATNQTNQIALKSNGYNAYHLGIIIGAKYSFALGGYRQNTGQSAMINAKIEYEYLALHTQKSLDFAYMSNNAMGNVAQGLQNGLRFGLPFRHRLNANLGIAKDFANGLNLGFEIGFATLLNANSPQSLAPEIIKQTLYTFGANATIGYRF